MHLWYTEEQTQDIRFSLKVRETVYSGRSEFQTIDIIDTYAYGRLLALEGLVMTTEKDEFVYHEIISHVPICIHPDPRKVLIIGGGDGGTLREIVKHENIEKAFLVEIDGDVVALSKKYLPFLHGGWDHPKSEVIIMNGFDFLKNRENEFDIIIVDGTDPIGPGIILFEDNFYTLVARSLKSNGIMVQQTEGFWYHSDIIAKVHKTMIKHFASVDFFTAPIPSYPAGFWNFSLCSKIKMEKPGNLFNEKRLAKVGDLRYLNPELARASFALPNFAIKSLK